MGNGNLAACSVAVRLEEQEQIQIDKTQRGIRRRDALL